MRFLLKHLIGAVIAIAAASANAEYNDNFVAKITHILTYENGQFLIALDKMPNGPCSYYFIVPAEVSSDGRHMMLSRALLAKSTSEPINIGYDAKTCAGGYYRVYRIG